MVIVIINGPNLNLLGKRAPEIYGHVSFEEYLETLRATNTQDEIIYLQSNHEGKLIDWLQEYGFGKADGILLNAGGYTHTSIALRDAVEAIETPVIEVHISNIQEREDFRKHSYLTDVCQTSIIGKGINGYQLAIDYLRTDSLIRQ